MEYGADKFILSSIVAMRLKCEVNKLNGEHNKSLKIKKESVPRKRKHIVQDGHRYCPKCSESKPIDFFYNDKSRKDGKTTYCKICSGKLKKDHPEYDKNRIDLMKQKTIDKKKDAINRKTKVCKKCGTEKDKSEFLTVNGNIDGYTTYCKDCGSKYHKYNKVKNRDHYRKMWTKDGISKRLGVDKSEIPEFLIEAVIHRIDAEKKINSVCD